MAQYRRILILFFHPLFHKSRVNKELLRAIADLEGVHTRIMYDLYPDFHIHMKTEQELLQEYDIIIWQHPMYWYSSPSLLKEWIDITLAHGFAYGKKGKALEGKKIMTAITVGGRRDIYREDGARKYRIPQLLAPFEQTVTLCNMDYLPPFVVHGTHQLETEGIGDAGAHFRRVIQKMRDDLPDDKLLKEHEYMNDIIP
jgi:glutathione-regulated potassium-efflux system ancillary protein KefG